MSSVAGNGSALGSRGGRTLRDSSRAAAFRVSRTSMYNCKLTWTIKDRSVDNTLNQSKVVI